MKTDKGSLRSPLLFAAKRCSHDRPASQRAAGHRHSVSCLWAKRWRRLDDDSRQRFSTGIAMTIGDKSVNPNMWDMNTLTLTSPALPPAHSRSCLPMPTAKVFQSMPPSPPPNSLTHFCTVTVNAPYSPIGLLAHSTHRKRLKQSQHLTFFLVSHPTL